MYDIRVITSPRPYIGATIDSLLTSFGRRISVYAEPGCETFQHANWCDVYTNPTKLGICGNWFNALRSKPITTPYVMMCEDDIEVRPGAAELIHSFLMTAPKNLGFFSPYCAERNRPVKPGFQEARMPAKHAWCGCLCMLIPKKVAEYLIEVSDTVIKLAQNKHLDAAIGEFLLSTRHTIWTYTPTLIMHTGEVSTDAGNNAFKYLPEVRARTPAL